MPSDFVKTLIAQESHALQPSLHLFGGPFVVLRGRRVEIPEGSKRLLVFVALRQGRVERRHAAGALWPIGDDARAAGNLRSALWRLNKVGVELLEVDKHGLALREDVLLDVRIVASWAARVVAGSSTAGDLGAIPTAMDALDLLPGWYDDWALMERERVRQRLLHALEAQSRQLAQQGCFGRAVEAAMQAVGADPLRESAQRALVEAHLAEGNWTEARRSLDFYAELLDRELGVPPGSEITALLYGRRGHSRAQGTVHQRLTAIS
ncbi:DNA-binding SARP family transcriptional activator [Streptomyces sp. SAI-126]|jgi:DNA-binding SARP family transcriptional activator|uniref:AfsR/SARP family transcriptional regulator n=1 Tax=unclassified Streptomyces TaxID=2593676 RepID=UPI0036E5D731